MKTHYFNSKTDFLEKRLVYQVPSEKPKGGETTREAPGEKEAIYEDIDKRYDIYRKAEEKIANYEASGDPRKIKWAKRLRKYLEQAKNDEKSRDTSMKITSAKGLHKTLMRPFKPKAPKEEKAVTEAGKKAADIYAGLTATEEDIYADLEKETPEQKIAEREPAKPEEHVITLPDVDITREAEEKPSKRGEVAITKEAQRYAKRYFENNPGKTETRFTYKDREFVATSKDVSGRQVIITRKVS